MAVLRGNLRGGTRAKDAVLTDGFNVDKKGGLTRTEIRQAKIEKMRQEEDRKKLEKKVLDLQLELARSKVEKLDIVGMVGEAAGKATEKVVEKAGMAGDDGEDKDQQDSKSAYQMLQDMRAVYKACGGRKKLIELCSSDDRQFVFMVKELMKIETALKSAEIRGSGQGIGRVGTQNFFVVLKGLKEEQGIIEMMGQGNEKGGVDFKQISQALTPDGREYEVEEVALEETEEVAEKVGEDAAPLDW